MRSCSSTPRERSPQPMWSTEPAVPADRSARSPACRSGSRTWRTAPACRPHAARAGTPTPARPNVTTSTSPACRAAGAIPIGKTAAPEFGAFGYTASPLHGVTRNPWNTERTPGGSSGGTAASVAAGALPFGTASDGGGSIRGPAASCGLPGLKPTYGRIPTFGVTRHAQNAVNFALAATIADTALLFDLVVGPDMRDRTSLPEPSVRHAVAIEDLDVTGLRAGVVRRSRLRHDRPRGRVDHPTSEQHPDRCSGPRRHGTRRSDRRLHPHLRIHGVRRPVRRRSARLGGASRRTRSARRRRVAPQQGRDTAGIREGRGRAVGAWRCRSPNSSTRSTC